MKRLLALALSLAFFAPALLFIASASPDDLKVADTAPDFTMQGSDGKTYKLSELNKQGKAVVLAWFPRAMTPGCTKECTSFKTDGPKMRDYQVAYFTASNDPVEKNKQFAEQVGADYPILSDV